MLSHLTVARTSHVYIFWGVALRVCGQHVLLAWRLDASRTLHRAGLSAFGGADFFFRPEQSEFERAPMILREQHRPDVRLALAEGIQLCSRWRILVCSLVCSSVCL